MLRRAVKIRIYPTKEQADDLNRQFGAVRFVYNKGLSIISSQYKKHGRRLSATREIKALLPVAKRSRKYGWLSQFDAIALQQACIHLGKAYARFFGKKGRYPRFKSKHGKQSSYHCTSLKVGKGWIKIPKLSPLKAKIHRPLEGKLKSITLSRSRTGKYYASLLFELPETKKTPPQHLDASQVMGLDMGLTHLLIQSDGHKEANPRFLKRARLNMRRKQKSLSRKQKGSRGRSRARYHLAKCHEKLVNARHDFQHKVSHRLIGENQAIIVETLKIKNMMRNHRLAKSIGDAAWNSLLTKLLYKAEASGKRVVQIDQWFASSKTCHICGDRIEALTLSMREWNCKTCGTHHDRDLNAALNIKKQGIIALKAEGLSVSANGGLRKTDLPVSCSL